MKILSLKNKKIEPISIQPIAPSQYDLLHEWSKKPELQEYFRYWPLSLDFGEDFSPDTYFNSSVFIVKKIGIPIGLVTLFNNDARNKNIEFGVMIDKAQVGKGGVHAIQALRRLFDYVFDYLGYNKVYCHVLPHRKDLEHMLNKYAFTKEGYIRERIYWQGKYWDEVMYGLTKESYDKIKHTVEVL